MPLTGSFSSLIIRGLLAGLIAGLLAGGVAFFLGEPHVDAAIAIEEAHAAEATHEHADGAATHSHDEDEALVSRTGQKAGLFLATALAGLALGAIYATVLNFARSRIALSGVALALTFAGLAWLAIDAVPFFKYPPNPPAVGDPETINQRTLLWLAAVFLGFLAIVVAGWVLRALRDSLLTVRIAATIATFVVIVGLGYILMPGINEVGDDFPASLLWEFRISSLAVQTTLWLVLGIAFAFLTERAARSADTADTSVGSAAGTAG